ncbi:MAG: transposase [Akkermansiaceae bacterium]|nr:transposase [Akkermansiaceae bacterium]
MGTHRDWYSRGYFPHCDQPGKIQSVTIRLIDAMPTARREEWKDLLERSGGNARLDAERRRKLEAYLDAGYGSCLLREPMVADMVEEALLHWDGKRYQMLAWVIMPNHMHFTFEMAEGWPLGEVLKRFKGFTSHEANRIFGREGSFWYPDYWDRYVRDRNHLRKLIHYIHENPVKAGLVGRAEEWRWSSARFGARETTREADHEGKF